MDEFSKSLESFKMEDMVSTFVAAILRDRVADEEKEEFLEILFEIGDYELDFLLSYTLHLVDMLTSIKESDIATELSVDDLMDYTLQHMGINAGE